jgi:hypothetical protein
LKVGGLLFDFFVCFAFQECGHIEGIDEDAAVGQIPQIVAMRGPWEGGEQNANHGTAKVAGTLAGKKHCVKRSTAGLSKG